MDTYLVRAASLNLRSTAKVADNIVGSLKRGSPVEVLNASSHGLWLNVKRGTKIGWVFAKYLARQEESGAIVEREEFAWMPIAMSEQGQREVPGEGNNPRIVEYLQSDSVCVANYPKARLLGFRVPM